MEGLLKPKLQSLLFRLLLLFAAAETCLAQATKAQLEVNETFFTITAALNSCGYDAGLDTSLPLRQAVRSEVRTAIQKSPEATRIHTAICQFWTEHQPVEAAHDVTEYVSLTLFLGEPPLFTLAVPEADLPPDASHVLGIISLLQKFHQAAGIHALWLKHQSEYQSLVQQFHDPVSQAITQTDLYLKLPFSNYPGQRFVVHLEPMLSPSQVNSRNYTNLYFAVVSPDQDGQVKLPEIRHTYLHFVLDPMALKHASSLKRLAPLLEEIATAPLNQSFKEEASLLANESLIRAIETRMSIPKSNEAGRNAYVQHSMEEGFILTRYFYDALGQFEKEPSGLKDAYGDLLHDISLERERKRARDVVFAKQAAPEVLSAVKPAPREEQLLNDAEQLLASGDKEGAQKLATQVLRHNHGGDDPGRATFILARIATLSGNMEEARVDFEQTVHSVHDPRTLAWSHIYLGRIFDIQEKREIALEHYRAALAAGDPAADSKAAAEKGLADPYLPKKAH